MINEMFYLLAFFIFIAGLIVGGMLFKDSKPRTLLSIRKGSNILDSKEIAGLIASVVVQKISAAIPNLIIETDKTIAFKHPRPRHPIHYVFAPKKDIKNIGELTDEDKEHIIDLHAAIVTVINREGIRNYSILTNGPGRQHVAYLHFHLTAE